MKRSMIKVRTAWRLICLANFILIILLLAPAIFSPLTEKIPKRRNFASLLYRCCYRVLNIKVTINGVPTNKPSLWICNHISWLDVLLLAGNNTVDFIAKSEVGDWPIIGKVVKKAGTLLIDRDNKFQAYRSLPQLQDRIQSGTPVLVFPEGTTTTGDTTLPFKPMFYQAAIREKLTVQPISLRYFDHKGQISEAVPFIGEDDFSISLKRILEQPSIIAEINFLPAIPATEYHRKELANLNRQDINRLMKQHQPA